MNKQFTDTITLKINRGMIVGNRVVDTGIVHQPTPESLEHLGLFDSSAPNYVAFSPGTSKEDFTPKDEDFVYPKFRLLSETIVHKSWNPIDFSKEGVLKDSMPLLLNQVVYPDHEPMVGNGLGVVNKVWWEEGYKLGKKTIPPGIVAELKIDGVANPKIARQLLMRPPAIHSSSVTVNFAWEKSHDLTSEEFYNQLGSMGKDGKMVRKVVTKVLSYYENSLVPHGADEFAKIMDNGKILNPHMLSEEIKNSKSFYLDWTGKFEKFTDSVSLNFKHNMDKNQISVAKFITSLAEVAKLSLPEDLNLEELTEEQFQDLVIAPIKAEFSKEIPEIPENIETLMHEKPELTLEQVNQLEEAQMSEQDSTDLAGYRNLGSVDEVKGKVALGSNYLKNLREETILNYKLSVGQGNEAKAILGILEEATEEALQAFNKSYKETAEKLAPLHCADCNSFNITRASSDRGDDGAAGGNDDDYETKLRKQYAKKPSDIHRKG